MRMIRTLLLAALALPLLAAAQDAVNGKKLYTTAVVSGKRSCQSSACHGSLPGNAQNHISNGIDASKIATSIAKQDQMAFLRGKLTDEQLNDLAAHISSSLGGAPTYLAVLPKPKPTLSPASLTFANQPIGTVSNVQTVVVGNAASATGPLVLGTISTTAGSDFAIAGGGCQASMTLPAGASCTVALTFSPTVAGTRSATLTVAHNGLGGGSTVSLAGAGGDTAPTLTLAPTELSYSQTVGTSSDTQRVVVGNTGAANLVFAAITLTGANAADFAIDAGSSCSTGAVVASGSNCNIDIRFTPAAAGTRSATLSLQHNAGTGSSSVTLSGRGNAGATAGLALDATLIDLGTQAIGLAGTPRTLTVSNNGQANLQLNAISVSGPNASEIVMGGSCAPGIPVLPKASCTVTLALLPTALGTRSASLDLASNAPIGTASVSLTGEAVATPAPYITLSQAALGFGRVTIGTPSVARSATLGNSGSAALAISSIVSTSSEFAVSHDCPASLPAGAACTVSAIYTPSAANAAESIVISSNAFSSPNSIVLTGLGVLTDLPVLAWSGSPSTLDFSSVELGSTAAGSPLVLVNNGPGAVTVSAFGLAGANADSFSVGGGTCIGGVTLAAGASCTVIVTFVPTAAGPQSASLLVASSGSNPPDIALSGTGSVSTNNGDGGTPTDGSSGSSTPSPFKADRTTLDFRAIVVQTGGQSAPLSVRITNDSASTATITELSATSGFVVQPAATADACQGVPWTLPPGASCTVQVVFMPGVGGITTGTMQVHSAGNAPLELSLSAEAETTMTNVGNSGGGAVGPGWLALLALAVLLLAAPARKRH